MNKAAIRTIFQQAAHKISKQVAMSTDRRISAAVITVLTHEAVKEPLPHAVEPLKFKIALLACPLEDSRDRQGIVRRKGRTDVSCREHIFSASKIGHISRSLAREQRKVAQAAFLRMFDFAIPISALDQADLHHARCVAAQCIGPSEDGTGTFGISLHGHAKPIPTG